MKNKIFSKVGILLAAMVLINTSIQAQSWLNPTKSIRISTSLTTDAYAQKVRPYGNNVLISVSNNANNKYCFTAWTNGDIILRKATLDSADIVVNDFAILGNMLCFCGKHLDSQGNTVGYIGKFNVNQLLLSNQSLTYQLQDILTTEELTKIVAYQDDYNATHVVAIGHGGATINSYGRFVCMDGSGNYNVLYSTIPSPYQKEIFEDIAVGNTYVATVGRVYPSDSLIVRYYKKAAPEDCLSQKTYTYYSPNVAINSSFNPYEFTSHITKLPGNFMAIATSAENSNHKNYVMINILDEGYPPIIANRVCYHDNKENKILEMEYSFEKDSLLLLQAARVSNQYRYSTLFLHLQSSQSYTAYAREIPGVINHLSVIPYKRYALAGIASSLNNKQILYVGQVDSFLPNCGQYIQFLIGSLSSLTTYLYNHTPPPTFNNNNWTNRNASCSTDKLVIECND